MVDKHKDYVPVWEAMEEEIGSFILQQLCNRYQISRTKVDEIAGHTRIVAQFKFGRTITIRIHEDGQII